MRPLAGRSLQRSSLRPTPGGVEGKRDPTAFPGSSGLRPSDTRAMKNRPLTGSSPHRTGRAVLSDGSDGADGAIGYRMGQTGGCLIGRRKVLSDEADDAAGAPRRGAFFVARVSRHEVPMTPGHRRYALYICDPLRVAPSYDHHYDRPLAGSRKEGETSVTRGRRG